MLWLGRQRIKCTLNCKSPKGQFAAYFRKELKKKQMNLALIWNFVHKIVESSLALLFTELPAKVFPFRYWFPNWTWLLVILNPSLMLITLSAIYRSAQHYTIRLLIRSLACSKRCIGITSGHILERRASRLVSDKEDPQKIQSWYRAVHSIPPPRNGFQWFAKIKL